MLPMLVPTMMSMGMPASSITFSAPMCAVPLAPPPLSTTPTFGRAATGGKKVHRMNSSISKRDILVISIICFLSFWRFVSLNVAYFHS